MHQLLDHRETAINHPHLSGSATRSRVVCFSDTFGVESNNGVGRFLQDLRTGSQSNDLPIEFVVPGKHENIEDVRFVRAPSFTVPGYPDLRISMPLEHQRKQIAYLLKKKQPDVIHVSTPGPFGFFGVSLANDLRLPLVGIYHTDFPDYAHSIVNSQLEHYAVNPGSLLENPIVKAVAPVVTDKATPLFMKLMTGNPQFMQDVAACTDIGKRNFEILAGDVDWKQRVCDLSSLITAKVLHQFYSRFTLVVARSPAQVQRIQETLNLSPNRVRCLTPGIDTNKFHPNHSDQNIWQQFSDVDSKSFKVLYVGRITSEKNFNFLLETWQALQERVSDDDRKIELIVVGRGDEKLKTKAAQLPNVRLVGALGGKELSAVYASSDILAFPSTTETLGQVGLEAGASGLPVIVADQGGPGMYVLPSTGCVLPTNDPLRWATKILEFARDENRQQQFSNAARRHISENHSLEASLESYWNIHHEAIVVEQDRRKNLREKNRRAIAYSKSAEPSGQKGVMVITDYHAGKRFGNKVTQKQKRNAIKSMLLMAVENDLDVIFGGDFGDHGSRPERLEADFAMLREVQKEVGLDHSPQLIRGNHDCGYTDQELSKLTGGCRVHESLLFFHEASRVAITHGHILGLHRVIELAGQQGIGYEKLEHAFREDSLDEDLKPSVIAYDLANLVESLTQKKGLSGLGNFWEASFGFRSAVAAHFLKLEKQSSRIDMRTWKLIASLVGTHNDIETAAKIGEACGSWATVFGHSHEPLTRAVKMGESGHKHLVGNAGNIHRKSPTCIVAKFPVVQVYRFSHTAQQLSVRYAHSLRNENLKRHQAKFKNAFPQPVSFSETN
ncbi:glycosyltransferase [Mariniblastus fucicola]|uniref:glycosyltransferase n=1 Tax=Mariniblastus fucicola TaxID=980251 RepID=UPI0021BBE775|nr:glycosyltransferase [Mariniblastus fucicola]